MSTFTLAISCLTTSNLPWFVDLTFQVSLQHWTLLPFTTGYCFCFGSISSFFLELFIHWSPVAYWAHTILGSSSFSILSFCLFILFMGLSRQEYWSGLPFPSPVDHILSELSTMTCLSWVALHSMAHNSFSWTRLWTMWSDWLVSCDLVFSLSALWWRRIRGLWKLPDGRDWLTGKLSLILMGGALLSKSLIQFSGDGWGCVPSLVVWPEAKLWWG